MAASFPWNRLFAILFHIRVCLLSSMDHSFMDLGYRKCSSTLRKTAFILGIVDGKEWPENSS